MVAARALAPVDRTGVVVSRAGVRIGAACAIRDADTVAPVVARVAFWTNATVAWAGGVGVWTAVGIGAARPFADADRVAIVITCEGKRTFARALAGVRG